MSLTFNRGTNSTLNNTPITSNMLFFTTDDNSIYMDTKDERYKIFGLNDNDIISSFNNVSINKYCSNTQVNNLLLKTSDVATNGNTFNKSAVGVGYYNDVIGNDIEQILYRNYPTITASITYLQGMARSALIPLWINSSPSTTWQQDHDGTTQTKYITEQLNINLSQSFLGYVIFVQAYLDDNNAIYPIITFELPNSITDEVSSPYQRKITTDSQKFALSYEDYQNNAYVEFNTQLTMILTNNQLQFKKYGEFWGAHLQPCPYHKYYIPISIYGWRL